MKKYLLLATVASLAFCQAEAMITDADTQSTSSITAAPAAPLPQEETESQKLVKIINSRQLPREQILAHPLLQANDKTVIEGVDWAACYVRDLAETAVGPNHISKKTLELNNISKEEYADFFERSAQILATKFEQDAKRNMEDINLGSSSPMSHRSVMYAVWHDTSIQTGRGRDGQENLIGALGFAGHVVGSYLFMKSPPPTNNEVQKCKLIVSGNLTVIPTFNSNITSHFKVIDISQSLVADLSNLDEMNSLSELNITSCKYLWMSLHGESEKESADRIAKNHKTLEDLEIRARIAGNGFKLTGKPRQN